MQPQLPVQILLLYQYRMCADGFASIVEHEKNIEVAGIYPLIDDSIEKLSGISFDIVLLEVLQPNNNVFQIIKKIKQSSSSRKAILISSLMEGRWVEQLIDSNLDAYVLKEYGREHLLQSIHKVINGQHFFCAPVTEVIFSELKKDRRREKNLLTHREKEVLHYLLNFKSSRSIAQILNISENTVRTHRKNIIQKFGVNNLVGLIRYACREDLLSLPGSEFCNGCPCALKNY